MTHPSEQSIAHMQHFHYRDGRHLSIARYQAFRQAAPSTEPDEDITLGGILAGVAVLLTWFVAIFFAVPVLFAAMTRP